MANNIKSTIIAIFMVSIANSILMQNAIAQAVHTNHVTEITAGENGDHSDSTPKPAINTQKTSKSKKSKVVPKTKHTPSCMRAQINRCHTSAIKILWGTGSFKEHAIRRLATLLTAIITVGVSVDRVFGDHVGVSKKVPEKKQKQKAWEDQYDGCEHIENQFVYAAHKGNKAKIEELLRKGVDVNTVATSKYIRLNKQTALHVASNEGHLHIMNLLLTHKANVNTYDSVNRTPLHNAAFWYRTDAINILLQAKADVNARDMWGSTPLLRANGDRNTVAALLEANANVTIANNYGFLPLHSAVAALRHEGVQLLLIQNPDTIKKLDNTKNAVLHIAVYGDSATEHSKVRDEKHTMVELLLRHNANPNLKNYSGQTAYDMAEHQETKTLLLSRMTQKR